VFTSKRIGYANTTTVAAMHIGPTIWAGAIIQAGTETQVGATIRAGVVMQKRPLMQMQLQEKVC
jgi:hypothetical protein